MNDNNLGEENNINNPLENIDQNNLLEENQINNINNIIYDEQENILKNNNIISNEDYKEDNYVTDSDIDDPKYMPSGNVLDNKEIDIQPQQNNIDNLNKSEIFLKSKVMELQNDANLGKSNNERIRKSE